MKSKNKKKLAAYVAVCIMAALLCACASSRSDKPAKGPDAELASLRFVDDGSRNVTVSYTFPDGEGAVDASRSGERTYDLRDTEPETEGPVLRFLPESLTGLSDFSSPVTDAADRAFLLGEVEGLAPPENGVLPQVQSNPLYLYVDDDCYAFYHTGEIVGDGVCGACSDFFRVSALSYKYLSPSAGTCDLTDTLLAFYEGEDEERPAATEQNYAMRILGEGVQKEWTLPQARDLLRQLLDGKRPTGGKTAWDWRQPEGGICLAERLGDLENRLWLYPDGSVCFLRSCTPEGPWADGSILYGQGEWDIYRISWQRVYLAENAFDWSRLQQLLAA